MFYLLKKQVLIGLFVIFTTFNLMGQNYNIVTLSQLDLEDTPNSITIEDSIAYITANESFHVVDISDSTYPILLSSFISVGFSDFNSIDVMNNVAYVSNGMCANMMIFDVSDTSNPIFLSSLEFDTELMDVVVDGTIAYTANNHFTSIDVSDPLNPFILDFIDNEAKCMKLDNDLAYIACWENGFRIADISNPENIVEVGNCPILNAAGVEISGSLAFVPKYNDDCIEVVDITDPFSPTIVSSISTLDHARDLFINNNYLYVTLGWEGLQVFDISDIQLPQEVAYFYSGNVISGVFVIEDIIFLATSHNYQPSLVILRHTDELAADFTATPTNGSAPLNVEFTNESNGSVISWNWDFDNDGIIDSYEENPTHIYTEIGVYSVSLTVSDGTNTNTEIKDDYIHVNETGIECETISIENSHLNNYPNPFNPTTTIEFSIQNDSEVKLSIFNAKGQRIKTLANNQFTKGSHLIIWYGDDNFGKSVSSGVYLYKLVVNSKAEVVNKCVLLK